MFDVFLTDMPGQTVLEKINYIAAVLNRCFALSTQEIVVAHEEIPRVTMSLDMSILNSQHENAFFKWICDHNLPQFGECREEALLESVRTAASEGSSQAKYLLALIYSDGFKVSQDIIRTVALLKEAAADGNSNAQLTLGVMYKLGYLVEQNELLGREWLKTARRQGNRAAKEALKLKPGSTKTASLREA